MFISYYFSSEKSIDGFHKFSPAILVKLSKYTKTSIQLCWNDEKPSPRTSRTSDTMTKASGSSS